MAAKKRAKAKTKKSSKPPWPNKHVLATALRSAINMTAVAASSGSVLLVLLAAKRFA